MHSSSSPLRRLSLLLVASLFVACPKTSKNTDSGSAPPPEAANDVVLADVDDGTKVTIDGEYVYTVPDDLDAPLPWDDGVTTGTLANGMRWYVEQHRVPEDRVELWLAVRVGSVQEDDDQQGLAHLLEHMAFNGTRNFPGNTLITYLESVGPRFGAPLNAHTSFEETVYKLQVPTDDEELLSKGFLVLSDWAGGLLNEDEAIEGERGVVLEEWRRSRGAMGRTWDITLPLRYFGAPHANRRPIGTEESLTTFTPDAVRRFYADWYRPDLMAVVVVGDIDPDDAQRRIEESFGDLPAAAEDARVRKKVAIPQHEDTLVGIVADPEQRGSSVSLVHKFPSEEEMSHRAYRDGLVSRLFTSVMRERLREAARNPESPMQGGFISEGRMSPTTMSHSVGASSRGGQEREALEMVLLELERARRFGVLESELERAKATILNSYRGSWADRENQESRRVLGELVRNFTNGENVPGIGYEYAVASVWIPNITKEEVDAVATAFLPEGSRVVTVIRPGGELPALAEDDVLATIAGVKDAELEAPRDVVVPDALVADRPAPGVVTATERDEELGTVAWTFENGAKVILKTTDFKEDEILFNGWTWGGHSRVADEDHVAAATATGIAGNSGAGEWDRRQIEAYFAGRKGTASVYLGELRQGVNGWAAPKDLDAALELMWLRAVQPRFTEDGFALSERSQRESVKHRLNDPNSHFWDLWNDLMYGDHPRRGAWTDEHVDRMDLAKSEAIYREAFGNLGAGTFVFVGAVDEETLLPLASQWIGSLPGGETREWVDLGIDLPEGAKADSLRVGIEPKGRHRLQIHGTFESTPNSRHQLRALGKALSILLREELRENLGGTYSVGARTSTTMFPDERYSLTVDFQCDPERLQELRKVAWQILEQVKAAPVDESVTQRIAEQERRSWETELRSNRYWLNGIRGALRRGEDVTELARYRTLWENISPAYVHEAAQTYLDLDHYVLVTMTPAKDAGATK